MKKKQKSIKVTPSYLQKKIEGFERDNPELTKAMELFDVSMSHYEQTLKSIEPTKIFTSSSTKALT